MSIQIVNKRFHTPTDDDINIGRGSFFGNPYSHLGSSYDVIMVATRQEAIDNYKTLITSLIEAQDEDLINELNTLAELSRTGNVNLVCHCKHPDKEISCHGDIIKDLIDKINEEHS